MGTYRINLKIRRESDLYHPLDADQTQLNNDVISYVLSRYSEKHLSDQLEIHVLCTERVDKEHLASAFERYVKKELAANTARKRENTVKLIWLTVIGLAFVSAGILLSGALQSILVQILSLIGAFAIKEAADVWFLQMPKARIRQQRLKALSSTRIEVDPDRKSVV